MGYRMVPVLLTILLLSAPLAMGSVSGAQTDEASAVATIVEGSTQAGSFGNSPVSTSTAEEDTLTQTKTFIAKPDDPGTIRIEMNYSLPDQIVELTTAIPQNATVTEADGFAPTGDGNYSWDEDTLRPSITLSYSVNRSGQYHQRQMVDHSSEGLMFTDTNDWTIASVPTTNVWWKSLRSEPRVTFVRNTAVDGQGIAGNRMVFLGEYSSQTETIDGQKMVLIVPEAASLKPGPEAIFDSMEAASSGLPKTHVDRSLVIAAPTTVDWGPYGLADRSDTWVRADRRLDTPANVWLHEFVHLRQDFRTNVETRWMDEGMAEYYAALFTLQSGDIDFGRFADHLERGTQDRYEDTVLSKPETWAPRANYAKGALAYGTLDREIRTASDQSAAARHLFQRMNDYEGLINQPFLENEIESLANAETASDFSSYTTTTAVPNMWSASTHGDAFGTAPANLVTAIDDSIEITGPYRNRSVNSVPPLVSGERLTVPVSITNEGDASGKYDLQLTFDGQTVATESGSLAGGENVTLHMSHTVTETGIFELSIDGQTFSVTVVEPGSPRVKPLKTSEKEVLVGETVEIAVGIENQNEIPAGGTVAVQRDGTPIKNWTLQLDGNETIERTVTITIPNEGSNKVTVGDQTISIAGVTSGDLTGTAPSETIPSASETTATQTPGFSVPGFILALIFLGVVLGWRSQ